MTEEEVKILLGRKANKAILDDCPPPDDPLASWFGRVRVALPHETWPQWNGKPMQPLCQFNLTELPYRPDNLADIDLITIFVAGIPESNAPNGDKWLLRAYKSLDGLVRVEEHDYGNEHEDGVRPLPIRWELIEEDYPDEDDLYMSLCPPDLDDDVHWDADAETNHLFETYRLQPEPVTKIGGWPLIAQTMVLNVPQGDPPQYPDFVFQIGSEYEAGWAWGDSGFSYFGRAGEDRSQWVIDPECYLRRVFPPDQKSSGINLGAGG